MGDFTVVSINGQLRKNGGNVAGYFCTSQGLVVNAVAGPVEADELLEAARWAVDQHHRLRLEPLDVQRVAMARAHYDAASGGAHVQAPAPVRQAGGWQVGAWQGHGHVPQTVWQGVWRQGGGRTKGQRIHLLLSHYPLPPLEAVYREVFEHILNETVSNAAPNLALAEQALTLAESSRRPLLFVLHNSRQNLVGYHEWLTLLSQPEHRHAAFRSILKDYVVVVLPIRELPALSQRLGQPPYEAPGQSRPLLVTARCDGTQLDAVAGMHCGIRLHMAVANGFVDALQRNPPSPTDLRRAARLVNKIDERAAEPLRQMLAMHARR